jgi:adenine-specific DNA-methyltransferase
MPRLPKVKQPLDVTSITHSDASRVNIPAAEHQPLVTAAVSAPVKLRYPRNVDLDPQLVWRGKDVQDDDDLAFDAPPLYIQEKIHPKVLIDDLRAMTNANQPAREQQVDLFADFNGLPSPDARTEFYQHEQHWSNRMILGDSLQVMGSLAEREGLRGKVQCIYIDPPYGIKFNSNFQWSTTSRDVKDGNAAHITREPEQVKAFRDTWRDGIHSYLTYLRDRLTVARDLLTDSGSIFVQIGDENVHRVRALMDEVFGEENFFRLITFRKTAGDTSSAMPAMADFIVWYAKSLPNLKAKSLFKTKILGEGTGEQYDWIESEFGEKRKMTPEERGHPNLIPPNWRAFTSADLKRDGYSRTATFEYLYEGGKYYPGSTKQWKTNLIGLKRLHYLNWLMPKGEHLRYKRYFDDFPVTELASIWFDTGTGITTDRIYVVQTSNLVIARCILMTTDPGDLVLDPTCGSGTTAYVAEQWGRRWITIDTSRVALALARSRIMGARYPYYLLADSPDGQRKEAELTGKAPANAPTTGNIRHGFVYERVPHITLKSIANNAEIDIIWDKWQQTLEPLRAALNAATGQSWEEWQIPREAEAKWSEATRHIHTQWWQARIQRQRDIDASIARKADYEFLYDKPYSDNKKVRVAGPFTVESISPHRMLSSESDEPSVAETRERYEADGYTERIINNLKRAGVQQIAKGDKITFNSLELYPGQMICAEGRYSDNDGEKRAAILVGPEFGTMTRQDIVEAAREAGDCGFDVLISCAFSYEAHASEFNKLGRITVLRARMNADLHMKDLRETASANLFVVFGDPDVAVHDNRDGTISVEVRGIDIYRPSSGQVVSNSPDDIAIWFIDDNYNGESFFVRHAYFLGANDPYSALKVSLRAEINAEAWESLHSTTSRPFPRPASGRIAVKVINHLGDEVMKVIKV